MNLITEYLIKSGMALSLFYLCYWVLMRKSTHFYLNRLTLLFSLVASLILPFIVIDLSPEIVKANIPVVAIDLSSVVYQISKPDPGWGIKDIVLLIYFIGFAVTAFRLIYQAIYIHALTKMSDLIVRENLTIVLVNKDIIPFAYFKKVYIPRSKMQDSVVESILAHEKSHLQQKHYLDLLMIEIIAVIQWFNPIVWLYEQSIKEVHEYLADETVLKQGFKKGIYQSLLVNQAIGGPVFTISHQFNQSLIKKRIIMMTKLKSNRLAQLRALVFIPLTAGLLMAFSNPEPFVGPVVNKVEDLTQQIASSGTVRENTPGTNSSIPGSVSDVMVTLIIEGSVVEDATSKPIKGVNVIIKGTTIGTMTDNEGKFKIKAEGPSATLVFSCIGYTTISKEYSKNENTVIRMVKGTTKLNQVVIREGSPKGEGEKKRDPYIIINGVPSDKNAMDALDPNNIESINVLKDEKAVAEYGDKGKDGVILITTKNVKVTKKFNAPKKTSDVKVTGYGQAKNQKVFTAVEQMPEFPGGNAAMSKFLVDNLKVPAEVKTSAVQGTVITTFVVQADGSVSDPKIIRGIDKAFDEEVLRVIKSMPKWIPGKQNGEAVPVQFTLPVKYAKK